MESYTDISYDKIQSKVRGRQVKIESCDDRLAFTLETSLSGVSVPQGRLDINHQYISM